MVPTSHYLLLSAVLFSVGTLGFLVRQNALVVFMSVELVLNAANLTFLAFARQMADDVGHLSAFLVIAVAAAEAAVGLSILIAIYRSKGTLEIDEIRMMKH